METKQYPEFFLVMVVSLILYAASVAVFLSYYLEDNLTGSWIVGLILSMTLINHLYYVKSKRFSIWVRSFLIYLGILSAFSFARGGAFGTGLLWALLFPFFSYHFLGYRNAVKVNVAYVFTLIMITLFQALVSQTLAHSPVFMMIYFIVFIVLLLMMYIYDKDKETIIKTLNLTSEKYSALFKQYKHGICVVSNDFSVLEMNQQLEEWFGDETSNTIGLIHQQTKHTNGCLIKDALKKKNTQSFIGDLTTLEGPRHFVVNAKPLAVNGNKEPSVMLTFEDITEGQQTLLKTNERAKKFESLSYRDSLTNIPNRRYFEEQSKKVYEKAQQYKQPVTLLLIDIDLFKPYNDALGHSKGDDALVQVAQVLNQVTEGYPHSFVARYGGEEFACVFYNQKINKGKAIARRIQEVLAQRAIPHPSSDVHPTLTVSIGIASEQAHQKRAFDSIFEQADLALYEAKDLGRNRIITYAKVKQRIEQTPTPS